MTRSAVLIAALTSTQAARLQVEAETEWFDRLGGMVDYVSSGDILDGAIDFAGSKIEFTREMRKEFMRGDWVEKYGDRAWQVFYEFWY